MFIICACPVSKADTLSISACTSTSMVSGSIDSLELVLIVIGDSLDASSLIGEGRGGTVEGVLVVTWEVFSSGCVVTGDVSCGTGVLVGVFSWTGDLFSVVGGGVLVLGVSCGTGVLVGVFSWTGDSATGDEVLVLGVSCGAVAATRRIL